MSKFNLENQEQVRNMISAGTIKLFSDHSELNIHFNYKDIEIKSELNEPDKYLVNDPSRRITQIVNETNSEKVKQDVFRELVIHLNIDSYINLDENDLYDENEDPEDDELDDDEYESYQTRLQNHFPGLYLSEKQKAGYSRAASRVFFLRLLMDSENKDVYIFASTNGLKIEDDCIKFDAPMLSKNQYEYMFWCIKIIDKVIKIFSEEDEGSSIDIDD